MIISWLKRLLERASKRPKLTRTGPIEISLPPMRPGTIFTIRDRGCVAGEVVLASPTRTPREVLDEGRDVLSQETSSGLPRLVVVAYWSGKEGDSLYVSGRGMSDHGRQISDAVAGALRPFADVDNVTEVKTWGRGSS